MELTEEQRLIVESNENIMVNAGAGTGKTATILAYAKEKLRVNPKAKILYLVYNKEMKKEADLKFKGLNVRISTIHAFAFQHLCIMGKRPYLGNLNKTEIEKVIGEISQEKFKSLIKYLEFIDGTDKECPTTHFAYPLFDKFRERALPQSHNNYLKEFCNSGIKLDYDYILQDESQDININVINFLESQPAIKVYVGDTNQAIYKTLNFTVDVFTILSHKEFKLTQSFRSSTYCLKEANKIIQYKLDDESYFLKGLTEGRTTGKLATLSFTNSGVFHHAIKTMGRGLSFYINVEKLDSITKIVTELENTFTNVKRHPFYGKFASTRDLKRYAYSIDDFELADAVKLYEEYRFNTIPYLRRLASINDPKSSYCILTVHGSKGLEFDVVDYKTLFFKRKDVQKRFAAREEEIINLVYVAATRASKINI